MNKPLWDRLVLGGQNKCGANSKNYFYSLSVFFFFSPEILIHHQYISSVPSDAIQMTQDATKTAGHIVLKLLDQRYRESRQHIGEAFSTFFQVEP